MRHETITAPTRVAVGSGLPFAALPLIGRVGIAAIFVLSGFAKLSAPAYNLAYIRSAGLPLPEVALGVAIAIEVVGGLLLIAGYRTRIVAAGLALFSVVTALGFHADFADQNQFIHFFKNIAMAGGLLQIVAFGAGAYSVDARRR
ncbi:DoxX family protein [Sphingomonas montanisoli]|uniref:DoxX family protein n=1 Tax=Sphingomonas montanisoli TaxID=2606412 RepID=A0A5D9C460_9SPHN|nr:DoxX family protein [Sphingomonas montanisoli]TZG26469.1 DoxX family protein [Sphingomonas montanisoli]